MKRRVAVLLLALDTSAVSFLAANVAGELPSRLVDVLHADDGVEKDRVGEVDFGYPDGADHVRPLAAVGLLERAVPVRAEETVDGGRWRLDAAPAQPLTFGYVGHAVALLVHG